MKSKPLLSLTLVSLAFALATANAASTITPGLSPTLLMDQNVSTNVNATFAVSVFDDTLRFASLNTGSGGVPSVTTPVDTTVSGTVLDYSFVNGNGTEGAGGSASIIGAVSGTGFQNRPNARLWTTTNPSGSFEFGTVADYDGAGFNAGAFGTRDYTGFIGTIDISTLTAGTVYLFYGANNQTTSFDLSMTGPSLSPVTLNAFGSVAATQNDFFVVSFDFTNEDGYETLTFSQNGSNLRYFGAVVTVIPEPSSALLGGLSLLALLRRRR